MIANSLRSGWRASLARPRLIAALWLWNALLALVVGWGVSRWLGAAFNWSPEADRALQRFQFGLLVELLQYDRFSPLTVATGVLWGLVVIAGLGNALIAAGVLEVLTTEDDRRFFHRFFRGAGHFFGRFLRLLIFSGIALLLAWVIVGALTRPILNAIGESSWERAWVAATLLRFALLGAIVAAVMAVLDIARAQVATAPTEQRGMLRAWWRATRALVRNFGAMAGIYVVLGACWVAVAAIGLAIVFAITPTSWAAIWLLILVQQAFMMARAAIRIARTGATLAVVGSEADRSYGSSGPYRSSGSLVPEVPGVPAVPQVRDVPQVVAAVSDAQKPPEPRERQEP